MIMWSEELISIVTKFAECGWDLIVAPAKTWLMNRNDLELSLSANEALISAVKQADLECGSCGCEFDPLYKRALVLLQTT